MKKTLIVAALALVGFAFTGCSKAIKCSCQEFDAETGALVGARTVNPEDYNATTCSGVALNLRTAVQSEFTYNCTEVK